MFDFLAPLFGRTVVYLLDSDGEVTKRWASRNPFGFTCDRMRFVSTHCLLLPDGEVRGPSYVKRWARTGTGFDERPRLDKDFGKGATP